MSFTTTSRTEGMKEPISDRQFFETEVMRLMDRLYGVALRLTGNSADAEDLVAQAVARAWEALGDLRERPNFTRWILRILTNAFVSDWRRRRARPEVAIPEDEMEDGHDFSLFRCLHQPFLLWWGTPEHAFLNKMLRRDIEQAFDRLPETYRIVMVLVELQGWSYAETAEALQVPVGTVRSRLARARSRLQRALLSHAADAGLQGAPQRRGAQ